MQEKYIKLNGKYYEFQGIEIDIDKTISNLETKISQIEPWKNEAIAKINNEAAQNQREYESEIKTLKKLRDSLDQSKFEKTAIIIEESIEKVK